MEQDDTRARQRILQAFAHDIPLIKPSMMLQNYRFHHLKHILERWHEFAAHQEKDFASLSNNRFINFIN